MKPKHTKMISFRLPTAMLRDLKREADAHHCSTGDVIRFAIRQHFEILAHLGDASMATVMVRQLPAKPQIGERS